LVEEVSESMPRAFYTDKGRARPIEGTGKGGAAALPSPPSSY
jgi:hypothetical protein